jgi:hypothetical protein
MTWIKPSFNWMMYRSGFGSNPGQEVILGIDITREGFEWALEHAALTSFDASVHPSHDEWKKSLTLCPVRVQWDPGRDWRMDAQADQRAIQLGLSGEAVQRYVNEWITQIEDVTQVAKAVGDAVRIGTVPSDLPCQLEQPYPFCEELQHKLSKTILPPD